MIALSLRLASPDSDGSIFISFSKSCLSWASSFGSYLLFTAFSSCSLNLISSITHKIWEGYSCSYSDLVELYCFRRASRVPNMCFSSSISQLSTTSDTVTLVLSGTTSASLEHIAVMRVLSLLNYTVWMAANSFFRCI